VEDFSAPVDFKTTLRIGAKNSSMEFGFKRILNY
jgi:hypothetical protein